MKFAYFLPLLIACFVMHNAYSMNIETGQEFSPQFALQLATDAYKLAQDLNKTALPQFQSSQERISYMYQQENEIKEKAYEAIEIAKKHMNTIRNRSLSQKTINIANKALSMITMTAN
ncbi:MAG TPA: hypothetical protein VLB80_00450 [Candidatus Babeliales bacterium]|nr:hypothetical protein [Candidatus Babeliales bacterium]